MYVLLCIICNYHACVLGHFTQLIWASSCDIGIGIARSRSGKVMVVANYRPPGNITGQFKKNVFLPTDEDEKFLKIRH